MNCNEAVRALAPPESELGHRGRVNGRHQRDSSLATMRSCQPGRRHIRGLGLRRGLDYVPGRTGTSLAARTGKGL